MERATRSVTNREISVICNPGLGLEHQWVVAWRAALAVLERQGRAPAVRTPPRAHKQFELETFLSWYITDGRRLIEARAERKALRPRRAGGHEQALLKKLHRLPDNDNAVEAFIEELLKDGA